MSEKTDATANKNDESKDEKVTNEKVTLVDPVDVPEVKQTEFKPAKKPKSIGLKFVVFALIAGLVGGMIGSFGFIKYFARSIPTYQKQVLMQESSAIIDVANKVSPSVVSITSKTLARSYYGKLQQQEGAGTGIIVTADGLILTNKHVVPEGTTTVSVILSDGKEYADATVVSRDPLNDIAFVKIKATGLPAAKIGDSSRVVVGQQVVAIGNALGQFQNTVTNGIISGIGRPITASESGATSEDLQNLFQTNAAINPGNSGGPLVNLEGEVIGINTAVAGQGAQNIGFAIPINEAAPLIASVKSSGKINRPYIGVRYVLVTPEIASSNNLKVTNGAYIIGDSENAAVIAGGPADKAGIREGDIITKIDGKTVDSAHSPQSLIAAKKVGDTVKLTVVRDGKTQTIDVVLQAAPSSN